LFNISQNGEIKLTRGDSAEVKIDVSYENGEKYVVKQGDKLVLTVKKKTSDKNALIEKAFGENGTVKIEPEDTKGFNFGVYKYDVELTTKNGDVYTVVEPNDFHICEEVTY
jgi:hypothetical protein